jgi:hypothetical protein
MASRNTVSCLHVKEDEDSVLEPTPHLEDRKGELDFEEKTPVTDNGSIFNTWWT